MPAKYSECISDRLMLFFTRAKAAGFQKPAVASLTVATCADDIASPRPPTPMSRKALLYFLTCETHAREHSKNTVVQGRWLSFIVKICFYALAGRLITSKI